jgi:hypothetical protein
MKSTYLLRESEIGRYYCWNCGVQFEIEVQEVCAPRVELSEASQWRYVRQCPFCCSGKIAPEHLIPVEIMAMSGREYRERRERREAA